MNIQYFHRYRTLARRGLVEPLTCSCGSEYVMSVDSQAEPYFICFRCNSATYPGIALYDKVVETVERFRQ